MTVDQFGTNYNVRVIDSTHVGLTPSEGGIREAVYHINQLDHFDQYEELVDYARGMAPHLGENDS